MKLEVRIRSGGEVSDHLFETAVSAKRLSGGGRFECFVDGKALQLDCADVGRGKYSLLVDGRSYALRTRRNTESPHRCYWVSVNGQVFQAELQDPRNRRRGELAVAEGPEEVVAPMPGRVVKVLIAEGTHVRGGEGLLVIEAMKMQNEVRAARAGQVERIYVAEGEGVRAGSRLVRLA